MSSRLLISAFYFIALIPRGNFDKHSRFVQYGFGSNNFELYVQLKD